LPPTSTSIAATRDRRREKGAIAERAMGRHQNHVTKPENATATRAATRNGNVCGV
jgi:hypothetical protein